MTVDIQAEARHKAARRLKTDIDALFRSSRPARNPECAANVIWLNGDEWVVDAYQTFANGICKAEGKPPPAWKSLDRAVDETVKAVKRKYPDHANMDVIWRVPPSCDETDNIGFDFDQKTGAVSNVRPEKLGYPMVRARIIAVPHGAAVLGPDEYRELYEQGSTEVQ